MKTYEQLTPEQKQKALEHHTGRLLARIIEGGFVFNDKLNDDDLQSRIDKAIEKANKMQTPWFAHEYIMDTCKEDIESMAICDAEDSLYGEESDKPVVWGIA